MAKNVFINYVSKAMCHTRKTADGKDFVSVSFACTRSKARPGADAGYATVAVNPRQIMPAKDKSGNVVDGFCNILLGKPEATRNVSVAATKGGKTKPPRYATITMSNQDIADDFNTHRKAYREAHASAAAAE